MSKRLPTTTAAARIQSATWCVLKQTALRNGTGTLGAGGGARGPRGANPGNAEPTPLARMDADGDGRGAQDSSGNDGEV